MSRERDKAIVYANELAEVKRMMNAALRSQFSLESLVMRLQTINDVAELREALAPAVETLRGLGGELSGILPNASRSLREVEEAVEELMTEVGTASDVAAERQASDEVSRILAEAREAAAQRSRNR